MTGTQLYNNDKKQIFPISNAEVITSRVSGSDGNVEENLQYLFQKVAELDGSTEVTDNIEVKIGYCRSSSSNERDIKDSNIIWTDVFELPDSNYPYTWKRTIYTYKGDSNELNKVYEIVAADVAEKIQNIYIAKSTVSAPSIIYPILKDVHGNPILDDNGQQQEDLTAFDNKLPDGWSETPVSISPATPYVFMSTRKKINAKWQKYSEPAQFGRWAFDSQLEMRYTVTTGDVPSVNTTNTDPGSIWSVNGPTDFTGKLWMITATSVNNVLNASEDGVIWRGPNLLSIIQ